MEYSIDDLMKWMNNLTLVFSFFAMFVSGLNWLDNRKQLDRINIYLEFYDGYKEKIYPIKRKNFSRAELKGILRELHKSRDNYDLSYMSEKEFLDNIFEIQDGKKNKFIMKIRENDFFEFKRKKS